MLHRARIKYVVATVALLSGCDTLDMWGCRQNAAIEGAKKLDQTYLSQLYAYAASGQCTGMCRPSILGRLSGLGNRSPVFEVLPHGQAHIKLSVCMEDGVMLYFKDVGKPNAALYLTWSVSFPKWDEALLWSASMPDHGL